MNRYRYKTDILIDNRNPSLVVWDNFSKKGFINSKNKSSRRDGEIERVGVSSDSNSL